MFGSPDDDARNRARFSRRALVVGGFQLGVLGLIGSRLYDLQITYGRKYALQAEDNRVDVHILTPRRGDIRDRMGRLIAESEDNFQVMLLPDLAGDIDRALDALAAIIEVTPEERQRVKETAEKVGRLTPVPVKSGVDWETIARVNLLSPQLPGIETDIGWKRVYRESQPMGHVLGYLGRVEKVGIDDDLALKVPGARVGRAGVEAGMELVLRGSAGLIKREVDARRRIVRDLDRQPSRPGRNLVLTIDVELQKAVLARMAREDFAALVALDVATGDILALCSTPTYDPAMLLDGISQDDWRVLQESPGDPLSCKAVRGQYPPGSTFKLVTAIAGLESGVITPTTEVVCSGSLTYADHTFDCWASGGHGRLAFHEAVKQSCDVYFYETARLVGIERLAATARQLGLGVPFNCGIAAVKSGVIPDPQWKLDTFAKPWLGGETLLAGIGQGYVLTTPLQLALMTARVASGLAVEPSVIRRDLIGQSIPHAPLPFRSDNLATLRAALDAVVNEAGGTGASAGLGLVEVRLAGKTGTAQVSRATRDGRHDDLDRGKRDHSLFVAYAPADAPRYAVAAIVEHGGGGSKVAGPLVRDVMLDLLRRDPLATPAYSGRALAAADRPPPGRGG